ncbi:MAG: glycosyltransferase family 4 protein [Acidobacteria bacterium]|nr:glycosyltransferase family 4 protein [Acidobacteriota bacterium]MBS1864945.1 glycosyltransferase family 4 protein [Acidobacteriota bacterium]
MKNAGNAMRFAGKRVAMVTFSAYPFDPRPRRAIDALISEGASVDLICLGGDGQASHETLPGITVTRIPLKHIRRGKWNYAFRYSAFIFISMALFALRTTRKRYDLVHVHNMPDVLVASSIIPKWFGAKVVLDLHDPMPELMTTIFNAAPDGGSVKLLKRLEKWSIARAHLVVTVNLACKHIFSRRSCGPEKIAVVMNSPDTRIFPYKPVDETVSADKNGKPFVIMYHGSLVERNGLEVAIDALAQIQKSEPNAILHVFGGRTEFLDRMMNKVRELGLENRVTYFGPKNLEHLYSEIDKCDIGVIPNHRNPFTDINTPTRIFEYLARGKAVIAPSTSGIVDYFSADSLIFFEAGDANDLAKQIEFAAGNPEKALEIARRGQLIYKEHTWEMERETLLSRMSALFS